MRVLVPQHPSDPGSPLVEGVLEGRFHGHNGWGYISRRGPAFYWVCRPVPEGGTARAVYPGQLIVRESGP